MGLFDQTKYDPSLFEAVKANYASGKSYQIQRWEYSKGAEKNITERINCATLEDFERELWDLFADFAGKHTTELVWGAPNGLREKNPHKPFNPFYDGLIFSLTRGEFIDCIENQDVSHFMSLLVHFGYFHLNFVVIEKP